MNAERRKWILDFLNKNLTNELKSKFNSFETRELVECIDKMFDQSIEDAEPDFIKDLKRLQ